MKRKFLSLLCIAATTLLLHAISSCSGIASVPDVPSESEIPQQRQTYCITGTFSMPSAGAVPVEFASAQANPDSRNAVPDTRVLTYTVKAVNLSNGHEESTESTDGRTYAFGNLTAGTWQITAYATKDGTRVMQSESKSVTISASAPYASASLTMAPAAGGSGDIDITISWEEGSGIGYCKMTCETEPRLNHEVTSGNSDRRDLNGVSTGTHELKLSFYSTQDNANAGLPPLYECTEYIVVYPGLTTNSWTAGSGPHLIGGGVFSVTKQCVETFVYRKIYVSESGDDNGTGTSERPFATIQRAMKRLNEVAGLNVTSEAISSSTPWELHVKGCPTPPSGSIPENILMNVTATIGHLKIIGDGSGAKIDANKKGRIISVQASASVSMQNIELTKGWANNGGGVYIASNGSFTMESGSITSCEATGNASGNGSGGGICSDGNLTIQGGTISGNSASGNNCTGGGVEATRGSVNITGGSITGNSARKDGNNIHITAIASITALPAGNNAFYDDSRPSPYGYADAVCYVSGHNFLRYNVPSGTEDHIGYGLNSFTSNATVYLGRSTESANLTWKSATNIASTCQHNLTIRPTKDGTRATIQYNSGTQTDAYLIKFTKSGKTLTLTNLTLSGNSKKCGIVNITNGSLIASSCTFKEGMTANGGGIKLEGSGASSLTSCTIENCEAHTSGTGNIGGGLYVSSSSASATLTSCTIQNCNAGYFDGNEETGYGGAISTKGTVTFSGNITGCNAQGFGGGVYVSGGSSFTLTSGSIEDCHVYIAADNPSNTGMGGGLFTRGTFTMEGGSISGCTAEKKGNGVGLTLMGGDNPIFEISGDARVAPNNDVYVGSYCQKIKIVGDLTATTPVATITPGAYTGSPTVLVGESAKIKDNYLKFRLSDRDYSIKDDGTIEKGFTVFDNDDLDYVITKIASLESGSSQKVIITKNVSTTTMGSENFFINVPSGVNVNITANNNVTLQCTSSSNRRLFHVESGANLTLTNITLTGHTHWGAGWVYGTLTINAGSEIVNTTASGAGNCIRILTGGKLEMNGGKIQGNDWNAGSGCIYIENGGEFNMTGGEISSNHYFSPSTTSDRYSPFGGVYVNSGGTFTMSGGYISGTTFSDGVPSGANPDPDIGYNICFDVYAAYGSTYNNTAGPGHVQREMDDSSTP